MGIAIDEQTREIIRAANEIISPVYLVGGSVRDLLLGIPPHDFDFSTPLSPDEIENRVRAAGKRPYTVGKRFGTIGFKVNEHFVEVTTFRTETYRPHSRKPDVTFIDDITHDLSRRDFTINAMALRKDGSLIDPFHGYDDLEHGIIRTVNKPFDRYNEDPLRMLRAARFASQLGFEINEESTIQAEKKAAKILEISKERWGQELDKLLVGRHVEKGLSFLEKTSLLRYMLPELAIQIGFDQDSPYHALNLWQHTLKTVRLVEGDTTLRWAALLHDIGKPYMQKKNQRGYSNYAGHELVGAEMVLKIAHYLKWPNERRDAVYAIILDHLSTTSPLHNADSAARFKD